MVIEAILLFALITLIIAVYVYTHRKPQFDDLVWKQYANEEDYGIGLMEKPHGYVHFVTKPWMPWGKCAKMEFENGFGLSVVRHYSSYGSNRGLYEAVVITRDKHGEWKINYETDITNDVIGWLNENDVSDLLQRVEMLDENGHEDKK